MIIPGASPAPLALLAARFTSAAGWEQLKGWVADAVEIDLAYGLALVIGGVLLYRVVGVIGGSCPRRHTWATALLYAFAAAWIAFGTRTVEGEEWTQLLLLGGAWVGATLVGRHVGGRAPRTPSPLGDVVKTVDVSSLRAGRGEDAATTALAALCRELKSRFPQYRQEPLDRCDGSHTVQLSRRPSPTYRTHANVSVFYHDAGRSLIVSMGYYVPSCTFTIFFTVALSALISLALCVLAAAISRWTDYELSWRLLWLGGAICFGVIALILGALTLPDDLKDKEAFRKGESDRAGMRRVLSSFEYPPASGPDATREEQEEPVVFREARIRPLAHLVNVEARAAPRTRAPDRARNHGAGPTKADVPTADRGEKAPASLDREFREACSKLTTLGEAAVQQHRLANANAHGHIGRQIVDVGRELKALDGIRLVDRVYHRLEDTLPLAVLREITLAWQAELEGWSM